MVSRDVKLIEYSKKVDFFNFLTHFIGVFFSVAAIVLMIEKSRGFRSLLSSVIYGITLVAVYSVSSVYHVLPKGELKRKFRQIDHSTVPLLIAGTATPCALITLFNVSMKHGIFVICLGWFCAFFGLFSKLFFFEKLKTVTMAVYVVCCSLMLFCVIPLLGQINSGAFMKLVYGCAFYGVGAALCALGSKKEILHPIFHIFVLLGSAFHFYVIYAFVI